MKKYLFCLICFYSVLFSCTKDNKNLEISASEKLTADTAYTLIKEWIFNDYNPQMNPSMTFSVEEITTDEIWNKTNGQVYNIVTDVPGLTNRGVYIKNKKVFDLGRKNLYGAHKPDHIVVADLDKDHLYELYFTLIHGSGVIRTDIVCYINDLNDKYLLADTSFRFVTNLKLEKEHDQSIILKQINTGGETKIGNIVLVNDAGTMKLRVEK